MKIEKSPPFKEILIKYPKIVEQLHKNGFKTPTPIQHKALNYALSTQDLLIQAPTGSGKTLIYGLKMLVEHSKDQISGMNYIILAPNTLLVSQIQSMISQIIPEDSNFKSLDLKKVTLNTQILSGVNCIISTPKILAEQLKTDAEFVSQVTTFILDEADIMLTKEYLENLENIIQYLPEERQDLLFSATYTKEMGQIAREYLHNPKVIELPSVVQKSQISQLIHIVDSKQKLSLLHHTLKHLQFGLLLIFVNRIEHIKQVEIIVKHLGYKFKSISSATSEFERSRILQEFKESKFDILIATDLVSRGIDVPQISHVINYSIPQDHTKYVHRIGRATRHTSKGTTINFISKDDVDKFKQVLQEYKIEFKVKQTPSDLEELPKPIMKKIELKIQHKKKK